MAGGSRRRHLAPGRLRALSLIAPVALAVAGCGAVSAGGEVPARTRSPDALMGKPWHWEQTVTPVDKITVPDPSSYTIELAPNGRLRVRADCNRGTGAYQIAAGALSLGPIATTRMACPPGSLDARYLRDLQRANAFFVEDGKLYIELREDSGTLRFGRAQ
jgi:heat shock protein HslJ